MNFDPSFVTVIEAVLLLVKLTVLLSFYRCQFCLSPVNKSLFYRKVPVAADLDSAVFLLS